MVLNLRSFSPMKFVLFFLLSTACSFAQTTVFNSDFATSAGTVYTTNAGAVGTSAVWSYADSAGDFGGKINAGVATLTNDASAASNVSGWALMSTSTATFASPYNTILSANPGNVTWTFNMRQPRANPSGLTSGLYGAAFILAGTAGTTISSGTGYAVTLGNTGKVDPIKLIRYNAGLSSSTLITQSSTTGLTDFGSQYLSIKVVYTPGTNNWQLYVRNDGTSFTDASTGTLTLQGAGVNNTSTGTALTIMGPYCNAGTNAGQVTTYDNVRVALTLPVITSLSPASKIAGSGLFTLVVNGANFISGVSTVKWNGVAKTTTFNSSSQVSAAIPASDITAAGTASVTVANTTATSNALPFVIDAAGVPSVSTSLGALNAMNTVTGTASASQTFAVSGASLTADVSVVAPTNFEVSTDNTTYAPSITLLRNGAVLTSQPVTVYTRVKAAAPAGIFPGNITLTTAGATTKTVGVSATVLSVQPATQSSVVSVSNITSTTATINWTAGSGTNHIVLVRSGSAVTTPPTDGITYTASSNFGNGAESGTANYTVYNTTGTSVLVSGLSPNTPYFIAVYDFNGSAGTENYLTTTAATGSGTTLNAPTGWQIYTTNTVNTITFDATVDGVNENIFTGDGIAPGQNIGQLNSNAWGITGFSDGDVPLGGTYAESSDYDRGDATSSSPTGGVYAFETSANNFSLGLQPATGDFTPGTVTLRMQNQTNAAMTSISIGYKVYVYNDQAASTSLNFSHGSDNVTYTAVSTINTTTPAGADASPQWKAYYRVVTITGLNIPINNYYYFKWNSATVSGSAAFDAIALDDIVMSINPTTNFASFSGAAQDFIVQGNTSLSGDTSVIGNLSLNSGKMDINGKTLTLNGAVANNTSGGLKGSVASNIIITGISSPSLSFDQTAVGTTNLLNNLNISTNTGSTVTLLNPVVVNGTLATSVNQTLNLGTNALTGTLTGITNNGIIRTQNTTSTPLPAGKTWGGTVAYDAGSVQQTIVPGTYQNLIVSSTGGGIAAGNLTVNGALNLPSANPSATVGSLSTGIYTLTMGATGVNTGVGDVTGIITRNAISFVTLYTFGHPNTSIIFPVAGTLPTSISLKITIGTAATWRPSSIKRTFDFIQTGAANTKAVLKAHYLDSELNGNVESKLVDWAYIIPSATTLEQGRSNYNTTENWVELTNANIGLYFTGTFGQVNISLDESEAGTLVWNGAVSNSWTTAANWTPNATPSDNTVVYIPSAATTPNSPTLNPAVLLGALNIDAGGVLNAGSNSSFTINNGAGAWINYGTFNPGNSNVIFTNADATVAGSTTFNDVTINAGAGLRPLTGDIMSIAGNFINNGSLTAAAIDNMIIFTGTNQTIPTPTGALAAYDNLTINGSGTIFPASLNLVGNLILNQAVTFTGKTLVMTGTELQTISGTAVETFDNFTINNTFGQVDMANDATVSGTLTLAAGNLNIANRTLTLGASAVSGAFDASHMIVASGTGEVRRPFTANGTYTFPIGDRTLGTDYTPITVNVTAGTFSNAYVGVSVTDAVHPNNNSTQNNISRYWKVNESGITGAVATITANYTNADVSGTESQVSAAELTGAFNQQTNPWVRFAGFGSNTLTASGALLASGQTSVFTGIKGGTYAASLSGYGSFCINEAVTLTAAVTGGDAPYTYLWSNGLGTQATATPSTAATGTINYSVTVKDANGITVTDNNNVTVVPVSVGGTVSPNQSICTGTTPASIILSGSTGAVLYWQSSADAGFTTAINLSNTTSILTSAEIDALTSTTYFRAVVQSGTCSTAFSSSAVVTVNAQVTPTFNPIAAICSGSTAPSLPTTSTNGYTGTWNPSTISNTASATYTFTPAAGQCATVATLTVTVDVAPAGGSVSASQAICTGTAPSNLTLTGNVGAVVKWQKSSTSGFTAPVDIAVANTTLTSATIGNLTANTYFRAVVQNSCGSANSASVLITITPLTTPTFTAIAAFCQGTTAPALASTSNNGITGTWNPATINNIASGTYTFTPNGGQCASTTTLSVTVDPVSVGGSVSSNQTICAGSMPSDLTLSGNTGAIVKWQKADNAAFTAPVDIANTASSLNGIVIGNINTTTYFRAVIQNASCGAVYSSAAIITIKTTIWDGSAWSNGTPDSVTTAVISGNYTAGADFNACTLTVNNNAVVVIPSGFDVNLNGSVTVSSGSLLLENNANLLQATAFANSGNITVKRNSSPLMRQDYTLWSSPVAAQNMLAFSPLTVVLPTSRFYNYNTMTNLYNSITSPSTTTFTDAQGYLIRMPNNHPTTPTVWTGQFTGVPHNGDFNFAMANGGNGLRFNLTGNPYPSPIDITQFVQQNQSNITGTLYFWRKTNNAASPSYCSWTAGTFTSNGESQVANQNGIIQTGQGFFVEAKNTATNLQYNNAMRTGNNANQFFRTNEAMSRIWLNAINSTGAFSQMALVYVEGADSDGVDQYDGRYINDGPIALNSLVDNTDYVIQGRAPFVPTDVVPLTFRAATAGSYTIAIDHVDGLFSGSQDILLRDNLTGTVTDIKAASYTFSSEVGSFNNRFEVIYQNALGTHTNVFNENAVIVYKHEGSIVINSGNIVMENVKIFDIRGRLLAEKAGINASEVTMNRIDANQVLIVRVASDAGEVVVKKVVN
jgi:hypothetical protein